MRYRSGSTVAEAAGRPRRWLWTAFPGPGPGARRCANQRGDSGTAARTKSPKTTGTAPTTITQRQVSGVISTPVAVQAIRSRPTLAAVPMMPARIGRERSDQASETMATPLGHMPPMPRQVKNRMTSNSKGLWAHHARPEKMERHRMLHPMALTRPYRSPSRPKSQPPAAAPKRKAHTYQANHFPTRASLVD